MKEDDILDGKALRIFKDWCCSKLNKTTESDFFVFEGVLMLNCYDFFKIYPEAFVLAIIKDWFESVGIEIYNESKNNYTLVSDESYGDDSNNYFHITKIKSLQKALKEANQLYNKTFQ